MNRNFLKHIFGEVVLAVMLVSIMFSCRSGSDKKNAPATEDTATIQQDIKIAKAQTVFFALPSPIETATLLKKAGAAFNKEHLNSTKNISTYTSTSSKALSLGVYGADLSYTSIFDQAQEIMLYMKCVSTLSKDLSIIGAFDEKIIARSEKNINNRDSLMQIISEAFWSSDAYLKDNNRSVASAMILTGGWIEGLYIATRVAKAVNNEDINTRIAEQKYSLENLIGLLETYESDENITSILGQLKELQKNYDSIDVKPSQAKASTDRKTGVTTINSNNHLTINKDQLKTISGKIETIRNKII